MAVKRIIDLVEDNAPSLDDYVPIDNSSPNTTRRTRVSDLLSVVGGGVFTLYVATRTALKALDTTIETSAILTEAGREGIFKWTTGDFSAEIAADTAEGVYVKADAIAATVGAWVRVHDGSLDVRWFGVVGDDATTDDTAAAQAAIDYFVFRSATTPSRLLWPPLRYLITDSLDFSQTGGKRCEIIGGNGIASAEIVVAYHGYGASAKTGAVFQFGDDASLAYQTAVAINGFHFSRQDTTYRSPIAIQGASLAQSRIDNITSGGWGNIVCSLINPQNVRGHNWEFFGGGVSFAYKDASAVTVTQSGTTLTASGSIFTAADVGKTVAIWGTGASTYRRKAVISAYTSGTQVTLAKSVTDATARTLIFGSPFASITATDTTLTTDAACFTANHVGLVVWVKGAGDNDGLLRAKIASFTSTTSVELDTAAGTTVTAAEFGTPSVEIYSDPGFGNGASDVRLSAMQIEDHNGIGLCVYDADLLHFEGKIHSEQTISTSDDYSLSTIWADRWSGTFVGDWDAQYIGEHRSWFGNLTKSLHIPTLQTRTALDEVISYIAPRASGFNGAVVVFGDVAVSGADTTAAIRGDMLVDENLGGGIPGYAISGTWSLADQDRTTSFLGRSVYTDDSGNLVAGTISFDAGGHTLATYVSKTTWTPVVADATSGGNVATGTFQGTYERVGNVVTICADCRSINTTGMTGGNSLVIRGFPVAVAGGTNNRYMATVRVDNVTFTGYLTAYTDNGDSHFFIYTNASGAASTLLTVAALTSGTANIFLSATYIA